MYLNRHLNLLQVQQDFESLNVIAELERLAENRTVEPDVVLAFDDVPQIVRDRTVRQFDRNEFRTMNRLFSADQPSDCDPPEFSRLLGGRFAHLLKRREEIELLHIHLV